MSEHPDHTESGEERVRRLLKRSRKVTASADFEARLLRRISNESAAKEPRFAGSFVPRRLPAYAYSLLAVAIVGMISYYMFLRPTESPSGAEPDLAPPQEFRQGEPPLDRRGTGPEPSTASRPAVVAASPAPRVEHQARGTQSTQPIVPAGKGKVVGSQELDERKAAQAPEQPLRTKETEIAAPAAAAPAPSLPTAPMMKSVQPRGLISIDARAGDSARRLDSLKSDSLISPLDTAKAMPLRKPTAPRH